MPLRPLQCSIAEVSIATIGVLLMNAESGPVIPTNRAWAHHSPFGRPRIQPPIQRMAPVDFSAATSTNRTATVSTPGFQTPASDTLGQARKRALEGKGV